MKRPARKSRTIPDPPAVAEVRRTRARLLKQAGGSIAGFLAMSEQLAAKKVAEATQGSSKSRRASSGTKSSASKRRGRAA